MRQTVLVSHFFNEEFLLPYFLRHHVPMFDHGVMIDHASTDRSVEIIRQLAPGWEVVDTRLDCFDAIENDREVEEHEARFPEAWKVVLNTTEFVIHPDLRGLLAGLEAAGQECLWMKDFAVVDTLEEQNVEPTDDPLWLQREHGFDAASVRSRMIHHWPHGDWIMGRHSSHRSRKNQGMVDDRVLVLWFGWSPMSRCRPRKLQIQTRIPIQDKCLRRGVEHIQTPESLQSAFEGFSLASCHMPSVYPAYKQRMEEMRAAYFAVGSPWRAG